ncbi:MAG: hypothetical protein A2202_01120 [Bdellovibrionales bacterium RIFOXYA1_FULL_36_14]|nr:MAG: hypothetical protein A2202_01120 [Bdellovibrionales bacterium RIFOXYA1_FULL_36_14]
MKVSIMSLIFILYSFNSFAAILMGNETGNGGDNHLSRYILAKNNSYIIMSKLSPKFIDKHFTNSEIRDVLNLYIKRWPGLIRDMKFEQVPEMLMEFGKEKAAINIPNSNIIKISLAYYLKYSVSESEAIVNVIHESGHKLGIVNHGWLDEIGSILVTNLYTYVLEEKFGSNYLRRMSQHIRLPLDKKFIETAKEYHSKGEGEKLAYTLMDVTKYFLQEGNLYQMFKYMTFYYLNIVDKYFSPWSSWEEKRSFQKEICDKFLDIIINHSMTLPKQDVDQMVKYALAHLRLRGRLYVEDEEAFNELTKKFTITLLSDEEIENKRTTIYAIFKDNIYCVYLFLSDM